MLFVVAVVAELAVVAVAPAVSETFCVKSAGVKAADGNLGEGFASEDAADVDGGGGVLVSGVAVAELAVVVASPTISKTSSVDGASATEPDGDLMPLTILLEVGAGDGDVGAAGDGAGVGSDGGDSVGIEVFVAFWKGGGFAVDGDY